MTTASTATTAVAHDDTLVPITVDIASAFERVRRAVRAGDPPEIRRHLYSLELQVEETLATSRVEAEAIADANVRALEMYERQEALAEELKRQVVKAQEQNERLLALSVELDAQATRLAEANVDALLIVDSSEERIGELEQSMDRLVREKRALHGRARELEDQAAALADSSAAAVELVIEAREQMHTLQQAKRTLERENEVLEEQTFLDGLTGLFNHRYLEQQIEIELARAKRYESPLSLIFIDIDHFKHLNDFLGHMAGDTVLRELAAVVRSEFRRADIPIRMTGEPFAVRYGGEEFVVILPETRRDGAHVAAERLRARIEATDFPGGDTQPRGRVTVSMGVAELRPTDENAEQLLRRADLALYAAKRNGRNRIELG